MVEWHGCRAQVLATLGVARDLRRDGLVFADTPTAIEYARTTVLRHHVNRAPSVPEAASPQDAGDIA